MGSIPRGLAARIQSVAGSAHQRLLARWACRLPRIERFERQYADSDDEQLRKASLALRYRAKSREPLDRLLPEAFALVRLVAQRRLGLRHYDVQIVGGVAMHNRCIAEMETGEGKTLTATLPIYLNALSGRGVHMATANDYLAKRDAEWMQPVYQSLGMTIGVVEADLPPQVRRNAYQCDITYGTAKEFGFDFLRDRLRAREMQEGGHDLLGGMLGQSGAGTQGPLQRDPHFALIDEADSILIDEARTPLIISAMPGEAERMHEAAYRWAADTAGQFEEGRHYKYDIDKKTLELTPEGRELTRKLRKPEEMDPLGLHHIYKFASRAVRVARDFQRDRHYVVRDDEIVIVDEFTGRLAEGRKWRDGVHTAIEAKEEIKVTVDAGQAAQVTVQELFDRYEKLGGMTGTAWTSARELKKTYGMRVMPIPTNRPNRRERMRDSVYGTAERKWQAVADEAAKMNTEGRPVLIGTRTIDDSERLSVLLNEAKLEHVVLNARHLAKEAEIVAKAGESGKVTVATNMAGRGTDIKLGEGVPELGGLHVICTEMHDSARIDRQLIGRCARQGDPGTVHQFLSLEDEILQAAFGKQKADELKATGAKSGGQLNRYAKLIRRAQQKIETRHYRQRKVLNYYAKQRRKMHIQMGQDPYLDVPS